MKVSHLRLRKLISGPGYEHHACEIEARLEDGDDLDDISAELRQEIERQLRQSKEERRLFHTRETLLEQVSSLQRTQQPLAADVEANRSVIRQHEQLAELARQTGIDADALNLGLPF